MAEITGLQSILSRSHYKTQSKNKYSFGKSSRFPSLKSTYAIDYYDRTSLRDKRTCSFGFAPKNPSSSQYEIRSSIDQIKKHGMSFGEGRDKIKSGNYLKNTSQKYPSSFAYNPEVNSLANHPRSQRAFLVSKHQMDHFIQKNSNPEPTKYDQSIEKNGIIAYSKFTTPKKTVFGKSARFSEQKLKNGGDLGPGAYEPKETFNSRVKTSRNQFFSQNERETYVVDAIKKSISPGPKYFVP